MKLIKLNEPNNTGNQRALKLNHSYQLLANYNLRINWLENKMCHHIDDSYQLPDKCLSNYLSDSYQLPETLTNPLYLLVNFDQSTEIKKNRQSFFDWRTKQKPSRRAGLVITAIEDSPGLIGGRLEPQRGRSLTVKAVCGGTLGWKDPPFNSILALPGATHQDLTQNEIIKDLICPLTGSYNILKYRAGADSYYTRREIRPINLIYHVGNDNYRINWLKNKMCRQTNDSHRQPNNYVGNDKYACYARINWRKK